MDLMPRIKGKIFSRVSDVINQIGVYYTPICYSCRGINTRIERKTGATRRSKQLVQMGLHSAHFPHDAKFSPFKTS